MPNPRLKSENYTNFGGINSKASQYVTGPYEFLNLSNFDFQNPGSLTKREGSTQFIGATVQGRITGIYEYERLSGFSQIIVTANTNAYHVQSGAFTSFQTGLRNGAIFDFVTFVDYLFAANGQNFFKWDGTSGASFSLPPGTTLSSGLTGSGSGFTGLFQYAYGYLNSRGYLGPCGPEIGVSVAGHSAVILSGLTLPGGYGITAYAFYRTSANGSDLFRIGYANVGATQFVDTNLSLTSDACNDNLWFTLVPRYIDLFSNQLMLFGFSSLPSTFAFSETGEPEAIRPENFIEFRTNDGDRLTGSKEYLGQWCIFKRRSFGVLSGDSALNFVLRTISDEYGALSNRAIVVWNDFLWFLDEKGICEFNGARPKIVSDKVEPIFLRMNVEAAIDNAVAIHHKIKNQIWFGIPVDGATTNNMTVVYDYLVDAWTTFEGFEPSSLALVRGTNRSERAFYGTYSGSILNFGASLYGDNGNSMSTLIKTRFLADLGQSVEKQWRRFYINLDPVLGFTSALSIDLFSNYNSATSVVSRTMYQAPFQSRIDFGIASKSLGVEIANVTNTDPIKIDGFTIEYRRQRDT